MKTLIIALLFSFATLYTSAQDTRFGESFDPQGALEASELPTLLADQQVIEVKVKGTVQEVCKMKGCWMTMALGPNETMRISFKDYGFFVPTNSSGKTAVLSGQLKKETISVETLKHYAQDAGKSDTEVAAITQPQTSLVFVADGVLFLD